MKITIGRSADGNTVEITSEQLDHHLYMLGKSGMGKTSCLCNISIDLMNAKPKAGLCVIDPLGALAEEIKRRIPDHRVDDVVVFEARDQEHPFSLNPFAPEPPGHLLGQWADHVMSIFQLICDDADWNSRTKQALRNIVITLLSRDKIDGPMGEEWPAALDEVSALLNLEVEEDGDKPRWRKRVTSYRGGFYSSLEEYGQIPVLRFWREFYDKVMTPRPKADISASIGGAADQHLANPIVRNIVGQTKTKINFLDVMNEGKILLVDLSGIGDDSANFLGSVIMAQLASATLQRERYAEPHFYIVADELYRYGNEAFRYISRQGRNFNVHLIAAQQDQTDMRPWQRGLMGNASNRVYFQLVPSDALEQAHEFDATPLPAEPEFRAVYRPLNYREDKVTMAVHSSEVVRPIQEDLRQSVSDGEHIVDALGEWITAGYRNSERKVLILGWVGQYLDWLCAVASGDDFKEVQEADFGMTWLNLTTGTALEGWVRRTVEPPSHDRSPLQISKLLAEWKKDPDSEECVQWMESNRPPLSVLNCARKALEAEETMFAKRGVYVQEAAWKDTYERLVATEMAPNGDMTHSFATSIQRGPTLYKRTAGRTRQYSDVYQQIANELTHLPRQYAKCKMAALDDAPPAEPTVRIVELRAENPRWMEMWATIKKRSQQKYSRPVEEVEEEAKRRARIMRRAVETWHSQDGDSREYHADGDGLKSANGDPLVRR